MSHDISGTNPIGSGLGGTLRLLAIALVLATASLGTLVVFEVIDLPTFGETSIKLAGLAAITAASTAAVWLLMRRSARH